MAVVLIAALTACSPGGTGTPAPTTEAASPSPTAAIDPDELLQLAVRNMQDAESKRLSGTAAISVSTQEFEVVYVGDTAKGTKVERATDVDVVSTVEFVKVDGSLYILAGEPYWQWYVNLEDRYIVVDHWVKVPADHPDHSALLILNDSLWTPVGTLTQEEGDDGEVVLVDEAGNRFTITAGDTPYLTRVQASQETEIGVGTTDIRITDFNEVTDVITAPPGDVVELQ
jgi:hypothetical protein